MITRSQKLALQLVRRPLAAKAHAILGQDFAMNHVVNRITDKNARGKFRPEKIVAIRSRAVAGSNVTRLMWIIEALPNSCQRVQLRGVCAHLFGGLDRELRVPRQIVLREDVMPEPGWIVIPEPVSPIIAMTSVLRLPLDCLKHAVIGAKAKIMMLDVDCLAVCDLYLSSTVAVGAVNPVVQPIIKSVEQVLWVAFHKSRKQNALLVRSAIAIRVP